MTVVKLAGRLVENHGSFTTLLGAGLMLLASYIITDAVYQVFFSPLSKIPGPFLCRISRIPYSLKLAQGRNPHWIKSLHQQDGPLVRTGPNQVACARPEVWKDVMTYKENLPGKEHIPHWDRDTSLYRLPPNGRHQIHSVANDVEHARHRRLIAYAFSEKSLRNMEPIVRKHVNLLIACLHEVVESSEDGKTDLVNWLHYVTFDIIGDLTFGSSFGCLQDGQLHPWIHTVFDSLKASVSIAALSQFTGMMQVLKFTVPPSLKAKRAKHFSYAVQMMDERLASGSERPDFVTLLTTAGKHGEPLSRGELHSSASFLVLAGSETSATGLSGLFYYILQQPEMYTRLTSEIRTAFKTQEDITFDSVLRLPYLQACIDEALRVYPPFPTDAARMVPPEGKMLMGHWLPGGTNTGVCFLAIHHDPDSFVDAEEFRPQRWLGEDERYDNDRLEASQPFSAGPRNCAGKNLAYAEMRLIVAELLWNFEFELCEESRGWEKQKIFFLWDKKPLMVKLRKVVR